MPIMFHMEQPSYPPTLVAARECRKLTQEELAAKLNLTRPAISQWETGTSVPSGSSRQLLALTLDIPIAVIDAWFAKVEAVA